MTAEGVADCVSDYGERYYEGPRPRLDMTSDFTLWRQQVRRALQAMRLVGRAGSDHTPSFKQAMQALYADSQFSAFVNSRAWEQAGLGSKAGDALQQLQRQLDLFEEPATDDALLFDPDWQRILAQVVVVTLLLQ